MKMKKKKISVGFRCGSLQVAAQTAQRKNGYKVWRCVCDCGGEILLDTRALQRGTMRDCGCKTRVKPGQKDITGQRFGRLVAQMPLQKRDNSGSALWHCVCDCGSEIDVPLHQLTAGYRKSCGCLSHPAQQDLTGKRFFRLRVLGYAGKQDGQHMWRCVCDCGKQTTVRQTNLQSGKTRSCGCLQAEQIARNLRLCDGTSVAILEAERKRLLSSNTSGITGVYQNLRTQKWCAQITFKRKTYYLGSFDKKSDAALARRQGEAMHEEFLQWYHETHPQHAAQERRV